MAALKNHGGYDHKFVETPHDRYNCVICHLPSREAHMTGECCRGQILCKTCLDEARVISNSCPYCRQKDFTVYPNYHLAREIKCLRIYCINNDEGCEWQGELSDITTHIESSNGCQFEKVKCLNKCGKIIQRQYLGIHHLTQCARRQVCCKFCDDIGEHHFIEGKHKKTCDKFPIPCPNHCEIGTITRQDLSKHRSECPYEVIRCSNYCGKGIKRQNLTTHIETECPLREVNCCYCYCLGEHRYIEGKHQEVCQKFPLSCPNKCEVGSIAREDVEAHKQMCPLERIQCQYHYVGCQDRIARRDQVKHNKKKIEEHLMMTTLKLKATEERLNECTEKLTKTTEMLSSTTEKLLATNQLTLSVKQNKEVNENLAVLLYNHLHDDERHVSAGDQNSSWFRWTYKSGGCTVSNPNKPHNADTISKAQQSLELMIGDIKFRSGDIVCPIILKMPDFNKKSGWFSDAFFTHNRGYTMGLQVNPTGMHTGKDTHMSWYLYLINGRYDSELTWPMEGFRFQITLLNQIGDYEHHSLSLNFDSKVPIEYRSKVRNNKAALGWGLREFISKEKLHSATRTCQYLKDNNVFFRVAVSKL